MNISLKAIALYSFFSILISSSATVHSKPITITNLTPHNIAFLAKSMNKYDPSKVIALLPANSLSARLDLPEGVAYYKTFIQGLEQFRPLFDSRYTGGQKYYDTRHYITFNPFVGYINAQGNIQLVGPRKDNFRANMLSRLWNK